MKKLIIALLLCTAFNGAIANETRDIFKGKLFPPNVVLEYRDELDLTREQFTAIRSAVVEVQTQVAEHEWDMQEAYTAVLALLDARPLDEQEILSGVRSVLAAENEGQDRADGHVVKDSRVADRGTGRVPRGQLVEIRPLM